MEKDDKIRIYGKILKDLENSNRDKLIEIYAIGYGITTDRCKRVSPRNIIVNGTGKPAECNGSRLPDFIKVWVSSKTDKIIEQSGDIKSISSILESLEFIN